MTLVHCYLKLITCLFKCPTVNSNTTALLSDHPAEQLGKVFGLTL